MLGLSKPRSPRFLDNADVYTSGIIVPQVNTAEEAATVVAHSKFPPQGLRGQGSAFPGIAHGVDIHT